MICSCRELKNNNYRNDWFLLYLENEITSMYSIRIGKKGVLLGDFPKNLKYDVVL